MSKTAPRTSRFGYIYSAVLLLALHYSFTIYINSNFLSQFFTEKGVAILYTAGSLETIIALICIPQLIRKFGAYKLMLVALGLEMLALFGLMSTHLIAYIAIFFIMHQALPSLLLFFLDVYLEGTITTEKMTGRIRSNYLTIINVAFLFSPLIVGKIVSLSSYRMIYLISGLLVTFLFVLVSDLFKNKKHHSYKEIDFADSIRKFHFREGLVTVFSLNFLLQCFYALMVIFMPIYLHETIGFNWPSIGLIFTVMLVPFLLFEFPLGRVFDKFHREQDAIMAGFLIMSISTACMFVTHSHSLVLWAVMLFASRTGASFVEVGTEYSFFKRVTDRDAGFISVFRLSSPLSYVIAPLAGGVIDSFFPIQYIFLAVSCITALGVIVAFKLNKLPRTVGIIQS